MKNKKEKILFFTNELAIMLKSGLTFTTAIEIILKEEKDENFKEVLKKIYKNLIAGKSIFESFKNFDKIFGNTYLYMLKIGEVSGSITERLEDISKSLEFDLANQKKLGGILVYPIVVISLTFIIVTFLLTFILPNFITIFEENQVKLPLVTRILLFISRNFHYILLLIIILILTMFFVNMY
ncbi:type II secretion system F family protein, partial [Fusobacterium simiae]